MPKQKKYKWSEEKSTNLIKEYINRPILWERKSYGHSILSIKEEAWASIAKTINENVYNCKSQIKCMLSRYRFINSNAASDRDEMYKNKWFAYKYLKQLDVKKFGGGSQDSKKLDDEVSASTSIDNKDEQPRDDTPEAEEDENSDDSQEDHNEQLIKVEMIDIEENPITYGTPSKANSQKRNGEESENSTSKNNTDEQPRDEPPEAEENKNSDDSQEDYNEQSIKTEMIHIEENPITYGAPSKANSQKRKLSCETAQKESISPKKALINKGNSNTDASSSSALKLNLRQRKPTRDTKETSQKISIPETKEAQNQMKQDVREFSKFVTRKLKTYPPALFREVEEKIREILCEADQTNESFH